LEAVNHGNRFRKNMQFGVVNETEYRKSCPRLYMFKLFGAFVIGMAAMLIGMSLFDYMYRQQNFTLFPPLTGSLGNTVGSNVSGDTDAIADMSDSYYEEAQDTKTDKNTKQISYAPLTQSYIGVDVVEIDSTAGAKRVFAVQVKENSPAESAGLIRGDEIISINHQEINSIDDMQEIIESLDPGSRVRVEIARDGVSRFVYMKLGSIN